MNRANNPLVSVYIPSHKRPELALRAINSVLNQSYSPIEIILCNDGSNDTNYLKLKDLIEQHNGVYIENSTPKGAPASRNRAIKLAQGELITGLDDDDEFTEDRIQSLVNMYNNNYAFLATSYIEKTATGSFARTFNVGVITHSGLLHYNMVGNQIFTEPRKILEAGGFDESLPAMQDHELWIRMCKLHGDGYKSTDVSYIVHTEHEMDRISSSTAKKEQAMETLQKKHAADLTKAHYKTHQLIIHRAKDTPLSIVDVFRYGNSTNYRLAISSYLSKKKWRA